MPHVSVFVSNGGYGAIQMALAHKVPVVVAGATEDKPEVAARVAWSGVGVRIRNARPTANVVRAAVREVLAESRCRQAAQRIAREMTAHHPADEAVELLERLAATQRPVLRQRGGHRPAQAAALPAVGQR